MGNENSKVRPPSRSSTLHTPPVAERRQPSPLSQPVDVPVATSHDELAAQDDFTPPISPSPFGLPASVFTRPPRLPLPIERDPEPPSPILTPQDAHRPHSQNDGDDAELRKQTSMLSSTTLDDEEGADIQQYTMENDPLATRIETLLYYRGDARHVYVTGTFVNWEKKFRMHRDGQNVFRTIIPLLPGTHHIIFLVDGEPKMSTDMPTTVDFANTLVNYIEVIAPTSPADGQQQPAQAIPIPGATGTDGQGMPLLDDQPIPGAPGTLNEDELATIRATGAALPNQPPSSLRPHSLPGPPAPLTQQQAQQHAYQNRDQRSQAKKVKPQVPRPKYTREIPPLLLHLDLYNTPDDPRYRLSSKAIQHLPQPPSLPMFMSKSILNATTPQKDDASVLTMPNHTVLNHLATSSIRQGVLATSGTTRYKRKVRLLKHLVSATGKAC